MGLQEKLAKLSLGDFLIPFVSIHPVPILEYETVAVSLNGRLLFSPYGVSIPISDDPRVKSLRIDAFNFANSVIVYTIKDYLNIPVDKLMQATTYYKRDYASTVLDICKAADKRIDVDLLLHLWLSSPIPAVRQIISFRMQEDGGRL